MSSRGRTATTFMRWPRRCEDWMGRSAARSCGESRDGPRSCRRRGQPRLTSRSRGPARRRDAGLFRERAGGFRIGVGRPGPARRAVRAFVPGAVAGGYGAASGQTARPTRIGPGRPPPAAADGRTARPRPAGSCRADDPLGRPGPESVGMVAEKPQTWPGPHRSGPKEPSACLPAASVVGRARPASGGPDSPLGSGPGTNRAPRPVRGKIDRLEGELARTRAEMARYPEELRFVRRAGTAAMRGSIRSLRRGWRGVVRQIGEIGSRGARIHRQSLLSEGGTS